ncbi:MAG: hypothetical protein IJ105_03630 [Bacilli bacterium]|nr:hypothetical protein [Bacilli bacterium]
MKDKIIGIILFVLIVFIIFVFVSSNITINKYDKISKNIDKQIENKERKIKIKENEYKKIKEENIAKKKQLDNMNNYINTLSEKVKEYEK